ncbi:glycoside hydrolase family 32 protein [Paenibacillus piri]|uniref:Sucrose-6-phosphate hydrolase n=1 Tax=Paenibacillus piri TaxID=2547395 RepID=A0A4R5KLX3_9BACL|nr:glycoside hydrolase family 32 protein [Paenibacillus piri]TDF95500.1 glycoside hydrolase family 32 protein [Paenibacillus piri]
MAFTTEQADRFIQENKLLVRSDYRLNYHLMGEYGWINDPNGFIHYNDVYHLFYQYHPYSAKWDNMHWGHAVSTDLVRWEYLPVALAPGEGFDKDGCFSGSAIEYDGKLVLMYTGHLKTGAEGSYVQEQGIAVSDNGVTFRKWEGNPVISSDHVPSGVSRKDFRDPKVFMRDGNYYVVLGSNDGSGNGLILLYRSMNLRKWEFVSVMAKGNGELGDNWECPDLFSLGASDVLIMSPQRVPAQENDFQNLHSTVYMIGKLNTENGNFKYDTYYPIDYGFDFYAPQTTQDSKGRTIIVAWMDMWESGMPTQDGHGWAGAMTLPREVELAGERLYFKPAAEIERYRRNHNEIRDVTLNGEWETALAGTSYELQVVIDAMDAQEFGLKVRTNGTDETVLTYSVAEQLFIMNRNRSGIGPGGERRTFVKLAEGTLKLRIFVDLCSIEVFIQDGEKVMTSRIYPDAGAEGIKLYAKGECKVVTLNKWDLAVEE